jgi:hypothetical protein
MAFSQTSITQVCVQANGPDLYITWTSTAASAAVYQVYVDHRLSWYGPSLHCHVPIPADAIGRNTWVDVGTVGSGEDTVDSSSTLVSLAQGVGKVQLSWSGGTYLDASGQGDIEGFRIYQSPSPDTTVNLDTPVDEIAAYPGGWISDGFGQGGFGQGGFGQSASSYAWTPGFLASGVWQFSVVPYDKAGNNRGTGQLVNVTVAAPPRPPALPTVGKRLTYAYSVPTTGQVTLNWLASPSS